MTVFQGKVVLVLGAGSGFGREIVRAFASLGAAVAANDINPLGLAETLNGLPSSARTSEYVYDIAKKMPLQALVDHVLQDWQRIDVLVNAAAVKPRSSILDMDEWDWHRTMDYNLGGCFFAMQEVGRAMRAYGGGTIINIFSHPEEKDGENQSAFAASQAAAATISRSAAREFAPMGIQVHAVFVDDVPTSVYNNPKEWQAFPPAVAWVLHLAAGQAQAPGQEGETIW